jgi:farnesol dehydrogenase
MLKVPLPVMNVVGHLMEFNANLTGKPPVLTPPWVKRFHFNWELSIEKAKRELGYQPLDLEQGLAKTLNWLEKQG